ncbi:MAG: redoxin family protein, partial [Bacteroidota bacterium]|nr:redoxin family protein [Bacteroidota bacterium]
DRRIVLFALPGAFTPTCSAKQLPMYEQNYMAFKKAGVDDIYCLSVNDSFVMNAWFRYQNIKHVKPIPDGSGLFTAEIGMMVDKDNLSFGSRSWRYALLLNDGIVEKTFIEDGFGDNIGDDPFEVSDAETVFDYITNESPVDMPGRQLTLELFDGSGAKDKMS